MTGIGNSDAVRASIYHLDFEASSLDDGSFPIEVAWVDQSGCGEHYLIKPAPKWLDAAGKPLVWSAEAEGLHGINFDTLVEQGVPCERVAKRIVEVLGIGDTVVYTDAPGQDGYWMWKLFEAADTRLPVPLNDTRTLYGIACRPLLRLIPAEGKKGRWQGQQRITNLAHEIVARAEEAEHVSQRTRHRALPDAESLWRTWRAIRDAVTKYVAEETSR